MRRVSRRGDIHRQIADLWEMVYLLIALEGGAILEANGPPRLIDLRFQWLPAPAHDPQGARLLLADGREKVVQHEARTRYSTAGQPQLHHGTVQDMTAELARQRQLEQPSHRNLAEVNLDVDGFQGINDSLGIEVGNQVLIGLARRLRHLLGPGDVLARLASDEFAVIRRSVPSIGAARQPHPPGRGNRPDPCHRRLGD